ncbi:hypothetical protein H8356DRAFT_1325567 [Neocallimastix lanati (nom. inval.)]|nr:hypothetical protein H8356DRAFT_1325567 [Neocallimastix sp. JGI-2020a]
MRYTTSLPINDQFRASRTACREGCKTQATPASKVLVTLAEWLTRWPAKPFPFGSAGSSPADQYKHMSYTYLGIPFDEFLSLKPMQSKLILLTAQFRLYKRKLTKSVNAESALRQAIRAIASEGEDHNFIQIVNSSPDP